MVIQLGGGLGESIIGLGSSFSPKVRRTNYKYDHLVPFQVARGQMMEGHLNTVYVF